MLIGATAGLDADEDRASRRAGDEQLAQRLERHGLDAFLDHWLTLPLFAGIADDQNMLHERQRNRLEGLAASLRNCGTGSQRPLWAELSALTMPVTVIAGELDSKFLAIGERLVATIGANASLEVISGAGHACHLEAPDGNRSSSDCCVARPDLSAQDMKLTITPVRYLLRRPIFTGAASMYDRTGAVIAITAHGVTGWGEALPIPGWPSGDIAAMFRSLRSWAASVVPSDGLASAALADLEAPLPDHPVAAAAVDCARHDLAGQRAGASVAELINRDLGRSSAAPRKPVAAAIAVNALVTGQTAGDAGRSAATQLEHGVTTLKLKVGADHISADLARLAAVREAVGPDVRIRLDANRAWRLKEAMEFLPQLAAFDIEYIEEPVSTLVEIKQLRPKSPIPLYVDEVASDPANIRQVILGDFADGVVLKPAALGSLSDATKLAERAIDAGLGVTVTNALDSGIGTTAAMHVAAAINGPINPCGFATGDIFVDHPADPPRIIDGSVFVPTNGGLGITPSLPDRTLAPDLE